MSREFYGAPLQIRDNQISVLKRLSLGANTEGVKYNEDFIRNLAFEHPECLPIPEIDSSFKNPIPVAKELRTPAGPLDALFVNSDGKLIVMEAKLWRNPEARRKVIGQILDYAKELSQWGYEDLQRAVSIATGRKGNSLYEIAREAHPELNEIAFVDGVSDCLMHGRFLLLIAGDGIRSEAAAIADFIQGMGTLEFTFGMLELALYEGDGIGTIVQPRILAKSEIIQRSVISVRKGEIAIEEDVEEREDETEMSELGKWNLEFWQEMDEELQLDDPEQQKGRPSQKGNYFLSMPPSGSEVWVSAYFNQSRGRVGVYITFLKGALADRLFAALSEQRPEIEEEAGIELNWEDEGDGKYWISTYRTFPDPRSSEYRDEIKTFLCDTLNRYVNLFRPRLERLVEK